MDAQLESMVFIPTNKFRWLVTKSESSKEESSPVLQQYFQHLNLFGGFWQDVETIIEIIE